MFLGLVGISIGVLPAIMIPPNKVWLVLPVSQAYFHLAQVGLAPWVGASHAQTPSMPSNIWSGPVIFGMFSLLLIQACFSICMCKIGPRNGIAHGTAAALEGPCSRDLTRPCASVHVEHEC